MHLNADLNATTIRNIVFVGWSSLNETNECRMSKEPI